MTRIDTDLPGVFLLEPRVFEDARGYFFESYNQARLADLGCEAQFVQDNESFSVRGVLRGLHYQLDPRAQAKLVRVVEGRVRDVAVDIRRGSPTFGRWTAAELSAENRLQMFIPRGFAHGFVVLSEQAVFQYKCDGYYDKAAEGGIRWDDPDLAIDWGIDPADTIVSEKDAALPLFAEARNNFVYA